jgi:hypothetical protein
LFFIAIAHAQEPLTNESIVKLVKAGLSEDMIVSMVNAQPAKYSLNTDDIVALKTAGVSEKIIVAMVTRSAAPAPAAPPTPAAAPAPAAPTGLPNEVGVYYKKGDTWVEVLPEIVNWKTGGFLKSMATAGVVKGDVNGRITGKNSRNTVKTPLEFVIYAPEGVAITEYQLLHLREQSNAREFRTVTGGVFHVSGGATRDLVAFEGKRVASRTFAVTLSNLQPGEYGFLPPGAMASGHASSSLGKIYSFRFLE